MHETQENGMGGVCGNFNRCSLLYHLIIFTNLSLLCVTYAHVHVLYAWNTMEQNNNNTVQVVAHAMDIYLR